MTPPTPQKQSVSYPEFIKANPINGDKLWAERYPEPQETPVNRSSLQRLRDSLSMGRPDSAEGSRSRSDSAETSRGGSLSRTIIGATKRTGRFLGLRQSSHKQNIEASKPMTDDDLNQLLNEQQGIWSSQHAVKTSVLSEKNIQEHNSRQTAAAEDGRAEDDYARIRMSTDDTISSRKAPSKSRTRPERQRTAKETASDTESLSRGSSVSSRYSTSTQERREASRRRVSQAAQNAVQGPKYEPAAKSNQLEDLQDLAQLRRAREAAVQKRTNHEQDMFTLFNNFIPKFD